MRMFIRCAGMLSWAMTLLNMAILGWVGAQALVAIYISGRLLDELELR
jgi:hypothetical protein